MSGWSIDKFGALRRDEEGALVIEDFVFSHPTEKGLPPIDDALVLIANHLQRYALRLHAAAATEGDALILRLLAARH